MTKRRTKKGNWAATIAAGYYFFCLLMPGMAIGAEALKKMRIAIPSIVIDFAPLWIAREKGLFREERIEVEITYIQGNIRGVQSLLAGEVQAGIAGSAGPIGARAAGEDAVIVAVPMNRLDYTFVARQPVKSPGDLAGKKIGIGAVGGRTKSPRASLSSTWASIRSRSPCWSLEDRRSDSPRCGPVPSMPPPSVARLLSAAAPVSTRF